jgi:hypothetical protein
MQERTRRESWGLRPGLIASVGAIPLLAAIPRQQARWTGRILSRSQTAMKPVRAAEDWPGWSSGWASVL